MVIAVEEGLGDISEQLRQRGYTIVSYPEYGGVVDAFLYKQDMLSSINQYTNSFITEPLENQISNPSHGVLIINANNKTADQVEEIIKKRLYSSLF